MENYKHNGMTLFEVPKHNGMTLFEVPFKLEQVRVGQTVFHQNLGGFNLPFRAVFFIHDISIFDN